MKLVVKKIFFSKDELHIILKRKNLEICEHSSFFNYVNEIHFKNCLVDVITIIDMTRDMTKDLLITTDEIEIIQIMIEITKIRKRTTDITKGDLKGRKETREIMTKIENEAIREITPEKLIPKIKREITEEIINNNNNQDQNKDSTTTIKEV